MDTDDPERHPAAGGIGQAGRPGQLVVRQLSTGDRNAVPAEGDRLHGGLGGDKVRDDEHARSVSADPKTHSATVKLGGYEVKVDYTVNLEENANLLFLEAKEAKSKLLGAEQAAKETELKIASRRKKGEAIARTAVRDIKPTKRFWFEAYKWFITSEWKARARRARRPRERPGGKKAPQLQGPLRARRCARGTFDHPEGGGQRHR